MHCSTNEYPKEHLFCHENYILKKSVWYSARSCITTELQIPPFDDKNISQMVILMNYINIKS